MIFFLNSLGCNFNVMFFEYFGIHFNGLLVNLYNLYL
ncbi:hypothetical protein BAN_0900012 [Borrelia anserina BA2]|uniref:Uncharacterized protein n=1 Tax=Borrelia anserina BA2 TaxID=1313293 RepID=W5SP34_BORAN|nr:hypothetical protein BAN_0900012 [Borrelia anserina BA2]